MVKRLIRHLWAARREFAKYFITGCSAFVLDIGSLYLLKERANFSPVAAVVVNQAFLLNYVFFINKRWSFRSKGITHKQMVKFYMLAGGNYAFSVVWIWFFSHFLNVHYLIARVGNIVLAVGWNFLLYKHWVYKTLDEVAPAEAAVSGMPVYSAEATETGNGETRQ